MARVRGRAFGLVGVALVAVVAASSAGMPPAVPQPPGVAPPLPALPSVPPITAGVAPQLPSPPAPPATFKPPVAPVPPPAMELVRPPAVPFVDVPQPPVVPPSPPAPEIAEPVATAHRVAGKYLGGDNRRALVYVETGDGRAEVQSRPLADAIPPADGAAKDEIRRAAVPAGRATYHDGRAFVVGPRELVVINAECLPAWTFSLPGNANNPERLEVVTPADNKTLYLTSATRQLWSPADNPGRVYVLSTDAGSQVGFALLPNYLNESPSFIVPAGGFVFTGTGQRVKKINVETRREEWTAGVTTTGEHHVPGPDCLFTTAAAGVGAVHRGGFEVFLPGETTTAAAVPVYGTDGISPVRVLLPARDEKGECSLTMFSFHALHQKSPAWRVSAKQPITASPVVRGEHVYFAAGNVFHCVTTATGAVCWKLTLPLKPNESLTDLTFADGELRASGPGVLVRIADRAAPKPPAGWFGLLK